MNVVIYFLCMFGFVIDSIVQFGLWEAFKTVFAPLWDPFGKGIWFFVFLFSLLGVSVAAFFPDTRSYGFGIMALVGVLCIAYVVKVYPNDWGLGSALLFIPSAVSIGISVYCVARPLR